MLVQLSALGHAVLGCRQRLQAACAQPSLVSVLRLITAPEGFAAADLASL